MQITRGGHLEKQNGRQNQAILQRVYLPYK